MKNCKKIIAILCIAALCTSMLFSCNSGKNTDNPNNSTTENEDAGGNTGATEDPRFAIKEDIPEDLKFSGRKFTILYPTWSMYTDYYFQEEEIGEKLSDAIYKRQKDVEERFDIVIEPVTKGYIETIYPTLNKSVKSGSDDFSMALTHCISGVDSFATSGIAYDWNKLPYVDFSKPWWNQRMNEEMSIEGVLLTAVSDFIIFDPNVIYFNKQLAQSLDLGDLYSMVRNGEWTWAKLAEMARRASVDLDGDGKFTKEDQYGLVTHVGWMMESVLQSCDLFITKRDADGYPVFNLNNEKFSSVITMLYDLFFVGNQTYLGNWDANNLDATYESAVPMSSGRALFHVDPLSAGKRYRAYETEFGILPFPKYDEVQKEYLSLSWNGFMVLPRNVDPEFAGAVCEALSAESYRYVVPAYYDVLLTSKVARDTESSEMIDIIYKGACYDFAMNYTAWDPLANSITNLLSKKSTDYGSFFEKNVAAFDKKMTKIYNKIVENYEND